MEAGCNNTFACSKSSKLPKVNFSKSDNTLDHKIATEAKYTVERKVKSCK